MAAAVVGGSLAHFLLCELTELQIDRLLFAITNDPQRHCLVRRQCGYLSCEITWVLDLDRIDAGDNIAGLEARLCGWAVCLLFGDKRTRWRFESEALRNFSGHGLDLHSKPAARYLAVLL